MNLTTSYDWGLASPFLDEETEGQPLPMDEITREKIRTSRLCRLVAGLPPLPRQD
jgi:hypothetical protein